MSNGPMKEPEQGTLLEVAASEKAEQPGAEQEPTGRFVSPRPFRAWHPDQGQLLPQYTRQGGRQSGR